jgi:hypothetical protein
MNEPILIGDEYLSQVRSYSALGYTVKRICTLLSLTKEQRIALSMRMSLPGDAYYEAYQNGRAIGEYNIDAELAKKAELGDIDAITLLEERKNERVEIDLRQQLFGV